MTDWRKRAEIQADVVHFPYISAGMEEQSDEVFVWDLDKTYLDTKFETLKGLIRTIFEKPFEKRNVAGTKAVVHALQDFWMKNRKKEIFPIYFITASPPQIETKIIEKLNLDGIYPVGLFCRDNLQNLRPKRFWRLTQQVGYKLQALLQMRQHLAEDVRQIMWGDDSEFDVIIYNLYSDICVRRLTEVEIRKILKSFRVQGEQMEMILDLQDKVPMQDPVEKIYINLAEDTDAEYYLKFGRRVLPTYNTFQTTLDLYQDGRLHKEHVISVAQDMVTNFGFSIDELAKSLDDLIRRQVIDDVAFGTILAELQAHHLIHPLFEPSIPPRAAINTDENSMGGENPFHEPWVPERIDYLHDYR